MVGTASIIFSDYDDQQGVLGINTAQPSGANYGSLVTQLDELKDSLLPVTLGAVIATTINARTPLAAPIASTNAGAQRGNKWRIKTYDNTPTLAAGVNNPSYLKPFYYDVPTADLSLRENNNNVVWVLGGADNIPDFDDVVAAFNTIAKSPNGGALVVLEIEAVTRAGG